MVSRIGYGFAAAALLTPLAALAVLTQTDFDHAYMWRSLHFWAVSGAAVFAAFACVLLVLSARSLRETRLLFLALAFVTIAGVFSIHGLMTRGYIAHTFHSSVSASPWISTLGGAILVALSAATLPAPVDRIVRRASVAIFAWVTIGVTAFIAISFASKDWLDSVPTDRTTVQYAMTAAATLLYGFAIWRYLQAFQFARLPSQAAMVACLVLLAQVPAIILWGEPWYLSWWIYHALYLAAFVVLFAGWAIEANRAGSLKAIADGLSMRDALAQLDRGHSAHMIELVDAIEAKDTATLGHVRRVSAYALAIGKKLGLQAQELRSLVLAIGKKLGLQAQELRSLVLAAELHDVGKIGVPDHILAKPGPLSEEETVQMQEHTERGYDIAQRVSALRPLALVIRAHHERLGGTGYPDGLAGDQIPLLARIIAVADSYDAMTSHRPYRPIMSRAAAVAELERVRGRELDDRCVGAFLAWLDEEQPLPRAA